MTPNDYAPKIAQLEQQLERERSSRKKVEEILRNKTMELFDANQYLASMTRRLKLALWAGNEVVWEYVIDEDCFYLYKNMSDTSANIAQMGTLEEALRSYHRDDQQLAYDMWLQHFEGHNLDINFVARRYSQETASFRWNSIKAKKVFDERTGTATAIIGVFKDIHEEYIKALSYKVLSKAFLRAKNLSFVIDYSTQHIEAADSFYEFIGRARKDVDPKSLFSLLPAEYINEQQAQKNYIFTATVSLSPEKQIECKFRLQPMLEDKMADMKFRFAVGSFSPVTS